MTVEELQAAFTGDEDHLDSEFLNFKAVQARRSNRPDLHAFSLLDALVPDERDIIGGADHDIVYIDVNVEKLAEVITLDQIIELKRCGVHWSSDGDGLAMFA